MTRRPLPCFLASFLPTYAAGQAVAGIASREVLAAFAGALIGAGAWLAVRAAWRGR